MSSLVSNRCTICHKFLSMSAPLHPDEIAWPAGGRVKRDAAVTGQANRHARGAVLPEYRDAAWRQTWPRMKELGAMTPSLTLAARLATVAALAGACALLAACGSTPAPGAAAPTRTVTIEASASGPASAAAATTTSPTPSGPAGCLASALTAHLGLSEGAAGTIYQVIVLTNTSSATCTLYGYPGVSFVTGVGGSQVGLPATKNPAVATALITLAPGGDADVLLAVHDAGAIAECKITTVNWLRIYPPGDYGSIYVQYNTQACANPTTSIMSVTPVRTGAGTASY
jgi:Protein of unknown function (DUF4232)